MDGPVAPNNGHVGPSGAPNGTLAPQQLLAVQHPPQPPPPQRRRLGVTWLLEFSNPRIESTYQHYMNKIQQAADVCVIGVNLFAVAVAYAKQHVLPDGVATQPLLEQSSWLLPHRLFSTSALCAVSGSQSLALLLLLIAAPTAYARHRGLIMAGTRLYRLAVWLLYLRDPYPPRLFRDNLALRLFLLSPASGSIWLALFYPLHMSLHLGLLTLAALVAVWPSAALRERLSHMAASPEHLAHTYNRLSRFSRFLEMPSGRLLARWPAAVLSDADKVVCMYAFVTLVYGLLLPLLLLYIKEVHFRVRFLACLRPAVGDGALARLRSGLYSTTTSAAFLIITLVPCAWSLVQLSSRYLLAQSLAGAGPAARLQGLAFLLTVLSLEVFMRFWLLAVVQLALARVVRPGLLWALLRLQSGQQQRAAAAAAAAGQQGGAAAQQAAEPGAAR